jgi:hypothetical protein
VDTGSKPHQIEHYLTKPSTGKVVSETVHSRSSAEPPLTLGDRRPAPAAS